MGGWAFVALKGEEKITSAFFPVSNTTNNRMEIQAAIEACTWAKEIGIHEFTLFTDSMYVIGTMTLDWKRKKNTDLWPLMDQSAKDLVIHWKHVKGHTGNKYNELCDALAVMATHIVE
jgi:ribonuclease HI